MRTLLNKLLCISFVILQAKMAMGQIINYSAPHTLNSFDGYNPNTSYAVGATAASADVTNGTSSYVIPIQIPSGTNNVAPTIHLAYSNQGGNGICGYGWSLTGSSIISRGFKTIHQDGVSKGVDYSDPVYLLDGKRMVEHSSGNYVKEMHDFSTIEEMGSHGSGPAWFKLTTKQGVVMEYGKENLSVLYSEDGTEIIFWKLSRILHQDGNYIDFIYSDTDRSHRLIEIVYTGNINTGLVPYNNVIFNYKDRGFSKTTSFEAGSSINQNHLLDHIEIKTVGGELVKEYQFNYSSDGINAFLKQIQETGSDGTALNPTIFLYGSAEEEFNLEFVGNHNPTSSDFFTGDFNGDGYSDKLIANIVEDNGEYFHESFSIYTKDPDPTSGGFTLKAQETFEYLGLIGNGFSGYNFFSGDFTGEGRDDVGLSFSNQFNSYNRQLLAYTLYDVAVNANYTTPIDIPTPNGSHRFFDATGVSQLIGDYNGDGIMDILLILGALSGEFLYDFKAFIYYGNSSSQFDEITLTGAHTIPISDWASQDIHAIDMDGDGRSEIMVSNFDGSEIYSLDGLSLESINQGLIDFPTQENLLFFGDFNGDRKTDLLLRDVHTDENSDWRIAHSNGTDFIQETNVFSWVSGKPDIDSEYSGEPILIGDFNGDGRFDIARGKNADPNHWIQFYTNTGTDWDYSFYNFGSALENHTYEVQDFNGDGKSDFTHRSNSGVGTTQVLKYLSEGQEFLLQKVKNGMGNELSFSYQRLTESDAYTRYGMTEHPLNTIQLPMYVPTTFKKEGYGETYYNYFQAKLHKEGKGFLGFEKIVTSSELNSFITNENISEVDSEHYLLQPTKNIRKQSGAIKGTRTIVHKISTYQDASSGVPYYMSNVVETEDNNNMEGYKNTTSTSYDMYGNATSSTLDVGGVETTTKTNTFVQSGTSTVPAFPSSTTTTIQRTGAPSHSVTENRTFNSIGQLESKTVHPGTGKSLTYSYAYNDLGNTVASSLTAPGEVPRNSSTSFDDLGRHAVSSTNTLGQSSSVIYDPKWSKPLSTTGINGLTTTFSYDAFGRLIHSFDPKNISSTVSYAWGGVGSFTKTISQLGAADVSIHYDKLNREIQKSVAGYGLTKTTSQNFNLKGQVEAKTDPSGLTTYFLYDTYGRPKEVNNTYGRTTHSYVYGGGNLTSTTTVNPGNQTTITKTDPAGKVLESTDNGGTLYYLYHSNGGVLSVNDGTNILVSSSYDEYGQQTQLVDINAGTTEYSYDAFGQLIQEVSAKGDVTDMVYNALGLLLSRTGAEGLTSYNYYNSGGDINMVSSINSFAGDTESFSYDTYGRLVNMSHTIDGSAYNFSYVYDQYDNVTSKTYPSGFELKYFYDSNGYLDKITNANGSQTIYDNLEMNALDLPIKYASQINGNTETIELSYEHTLPTQIINGSKLTLDYTWDYNTGNTYTSSTGNLLERTTNYTGIGNSVTESFAYDALNRLIEHAVTGGVSIAVDFSDNGNILSKSDAGNDYGYDPNKINAVNCINEPNYSELSIYNQTISYTPFFQPDIVNENGMSQIFSYGSNHQRIKSLFIDTDGSYEERIYLGDYETFDDGTSTSQLHYVSVGRGIHMIIARDGGNENYYRAMTDYQGSVLYLGDTNGDEYFLNYDAWGRNRDATTLEYTGGILATDWMNRGYTGHEHMDAFQIINMNGRMYDPVIGRMLSPDRDIDRSSNQCGYEWNQ